jgi:hypothetical protein
VPEEAPEGTPRHSSAFEAELISDPDERAAKEASNGLRQIDEVVGIVEHYIQSERPFTLRISTLLHLHRIALDGISSYAGNFRPAGIEIGGSKHQPVGAHLVRSSVEEMCDYVNENWRFVVSNSFVCVHFVAAELVTSIHGWERKDSQSCRLFGALSQAWVSSLWKRERSGTDSSQ